MSGYARANGVSMPRTPIEGSAGPQRRAPEVAVFGALADPTRRILFERLCARPQPVGVLAAGMPVSRPAVSQHLRALKQAGLVSETRRGTSRIYAADAAGLAVLRTWVERHWEVVLSRFAEAAENAERATRQAEIDAAGQTDHQEPTDVR